MVRLSQIDQGILYLEDVDVVDGTPLLAIKPYVPAFDAHRAEKIGWFAGHFLLFMGRPRVLYSQRA